MLLRSTLEKNLPVGEGERRLAPSERRMVFRGSYFGVELRGVEAVANYSRDSKDAYPYSFEVVRTYKDGIKRTGNRFSSLKSPLIYSSPISGEIQALNSDKAVNRVRRVEKIATRIKLATTAVAALAVAGGLTFLSLEGDGNAGTSHNSEIPACEKITTGTETLIPVKGEVPGGYKECKLNDKPYLIAGEAES